jgi:hypothetical protein
VPESAQGRSVTLQVGMKTMKEIIRELGLEVGGTEQTATLAAHETKKSLAIPTKLQIETFGE